jgi:hypothetical protein
MLGAVEEILAGFLFGEVIVAETTISCDGMTIGLPSFGPKNVVRGEHQIKRFFLRGFPKRYVDGHLVAIEVGVEARADHRVETNGVAIDKDRLEGLDAKAVQSRRAVQKNRVLADDLFDDIEDDAVVAIDDLIGLLVGGHIASLDEKSGDERTE